MANLKIKVDYYSAEEREKIRKNFPQDFAKIDTLAGTVISVPYEDFRVFSFFRHQHDRDGFRTFQDISQLVKATQEYEHAVVYDNQRETLLAKLDYPTVNPISESIGVAGGLSIGSHIYSLTPADWESIPKGTFKDLDFKHITATPNRYINIETKGCITDNNQVKTDAVRQHKMKIVAKKVVPEFKMKYNYNNDTCLGIVSVLDTSNVVQAWIVDPQFESPEISPDKFKLLTRIYHYYSIIKYFAPRANFTIALANRYRTIELVEGYSSLSRLPLLNQNLEKISFSQAFFATRTTTTDNNIVGKIFFTRKMIFFIGMETTCLNLMISQDFTEITNFKAVPNTRDVTMRCIVNSKHKGQIDRLAKTKKLSTRRKESNNRLSFTMSLNLITTSSGMCFAYLHY